jgi:hypothetical protein
VPRKSSSSERLLGELLPLAVCLALLGGVVGVSAGVLATVVYATTKNWTVVIPVAGWARGLGAAVLIGAGAGLLHAIRAARMSPTEALRTVWACASRRVAEHETFGGACGVWGMAPEPASPLGRDRGEHSVSAA